MLYNILAIGDVVGGCGVSCLEHHLRAAKKLKNIHFTVVNGENAAMVGLTPNDAERIFSAGADVITLGNHTSSPSSRSRRFSAVFRAATASRRRAPARYRERFLHWMTRRGSA